MKNKKYPSLVRLIFVTTLTIIIWIAITVYHVIVKESPVIIDENISQPIDPSLNQDVMQAIEEGHFIEQKDLPEVPVVQPSPQSEVEITPSASPSGILE